MTWNGFVLFSFRKTKLQNPVEKKPCHSVTEGKFEAISGLVCRTAITKCPTLGDLKTEMDFLMFLDFMHQIKVLDSCCLGKPLTSSCRWHFLTESLLGLSSVLTMEGETPRVSSYTHEDHSPMGLELHSSDLI